MSGLARLLTISGVALGVAGPVLADGAADLPAPIDVLASLERIGPWERVAPAHEYVPDNLWEYIDGGAALFVSYGFTTMATAEYAADGIKGTATVDVYLVPDDLHAFGLYSRERGPKGIAATIGAEAVIDGAAARFYTGRYYVKLKIVPAPEDVGAHLRPIARAVEAVLPGPGRPPDILAAFPAAGQVPNTLQFIGTDLLGHAFLRSGFLVDYDLGGDDPARVFAFVGDSEEEATDAFGKLRAFFEKRGGPTTGVAGLGGAAFTGKEPFYGPGLVARKERIVAGVVRAPTGSRAAALLDAVLQGLTERL